MIDGQNNHQIRPLTTRMMKHLQQILPLRVEMTRAIKVKVDVTLRVTDPENARIFGIAFITRLRKGGRNQ